MSTVNDISEVLRVPLNAIAEAQKNLQVMKNFSDRKEYLVKEYGVLSLTMAEISILGANDFCTSMENNEEAILALAVNGIKAIIDSFNPSPSSIS